MDIFEDRQPAGNAPEYTVSELSGAVKRVIEGEFGRVRVRGELGKVTVHRSGHIYTDLKDDSACISAVAWRGVAQRLKITPEEGMEVIATGRLTTFAPQSKYQLSIESLELAGVGALMALLDRRRRALEAEGLFAPSLKKPLPFLPRTIGVITSPSGAVIRDILHRLRDRFPRHVLIWPVAVQGDRCAPEVAAAIRGFNALAPDGPVPRPDLLIVARGGGSVEDLWGFNEEIVVRAAAESAIPLISAVGHETDTTLIDLAADRRAPTPTAAAEMAVPVRLDLLSWTDEQSARLRHALTQRLERSRQRTRDLARALPRPERLMEAPRQRLDRAEERLATAMAHLFRLRRTRLAAVRLRPSLLSQLPVRARQEVERTSATLTRAMTAVVERRRLRVVAVSDRLRPAELGRQHGRAAGDLARVSFRLGVAASTGLTRLAQRLDGLERLRLSVGYAETLKRGYAVVRGNGVVVTSVEAARNAKEIEIEFTDGRLSLGRSRRRGRDDPDQGTLF